MSSGAKHCIYNIIQALIDDGDEVIIPAPYWVSYPEMVKAAGGACRFIPGLKKRIILSLPRLNLKSPPRTRPNF